MAVAEGAALDILAREAHGVALCEERRVREHLCERPVDLACPDRACALLEESRDRLVERRVVGCGTELLGKLLEGFLRYARLDRLVRVLARESGPRALERIDHRIDRLLLRSVLRLVEHAIPCGEHRVDLSFRHRAFADELRAVGLERRARLLHAVVEERLREHRLVCLVVAVLPVAPHLDDDVVAERLAPVDRKLRGPRARLGVVAVHMEHGTFEALRAVGAVVAAEGVARIGGEADLVVDDHMDRAADGVAVEVHHVEALGHDALTRERSVAVDEDRHDHLALGVAHQALLAAAAAHHDAVHELEVRRVRRKHHAELLPRRGRLLVRVAHVVLHIAAARRERGRPRLVKLCEDLLQVLADDVREHIETPAVRHAERELTDAERRA